MQTNEVVIVKIVCHESEVFDAQQLEGLRKEPAYLQRLDDCENVISMHSYEVLSCYLRKLSFFSRLRRK